MPLRHNQVNNTGCTHKHRHAHTTRPLNFAQQAWNLLASSRVMSEHVATVCHGTISETITGTIGFAVYIGPGFLSVSANWFQGPESLFFTLHVRGSLPLSLCLLRTKSEHVIYIWMSVCNLPGVPLNRNVWKKKKTPMRRAYTFFSCVELNKVGKCVQSCGFGEIERDVMEGDTVNAQTAWCSLTYE